VPTPEPHEENSEYIDAEYEPDERPPTSTALRVRPRDFVPAPLIDAEEMVRRRGEIERIVADNLVEGTDYGVIPGTRKATMFKAGAERLANWFGYSIEFPHRLRRITEDWEHEFLDYNYTCRLVHRMTATVVAECEGSANSAERKYVTARTPDGRGKPVSLGDQKNTLQKMAQKRALVGAVLLGCALSDRFTQDLDDTAISGGGASGPAPAPEVPDDPGSFVLDFGKHSGETAREIFESDYGYVKWCVEQSLDRLPDSVLLWMERALATGDVGEEPAETPETPPAAESSAPTRDRREEGEPMATDEQLARIRDMIEAAKIDPKEQSRYYARLARGNVTLAEAKKMFSDLKGADGADEADHNPEPDVDPEYDYPISWEE